MIKITAIQRLCVHDGPGVRTTIFLKGCLLDCPWCCNPETKNDAPEVYIDDEQIVQRVTADMLFEKIVADKDYFGIDGGVTFSGGEPLLHAKELLPLLKMIKNSNISICFETSLYASFECVELVKEFTDYFIVDFKVINKPFFIKNSETDIDLTRNLAYLRDKVYTTRMVLIEGITDTEQNINRLKELIQQYKLPSPEFLQYHTLGVKKGEKLGISNSFFKESSMERIKEIKRCFTNAKYSKI